ncbi:DUF3618 domain-containing protein [Micromonospora sonneratiae]|uniref:DUF3618 domain-containing protein n=1 Tax=Micromonospora sonneratiae TaxID=1184706 RepID=A0ABW3YIB7_9ACTN
MTDPDEIRRDIERTRDELSGDVNALTHKVAPRRVAGETMSHARSRLAGFKERIMGAPTDGDGHVRASEAAQRVSAAGSSMRGAAGTAREKAGEAAGTAREKVGEVGHAQRERIEGSPLAAGLIAFGLGVLVSSMLPSSARERQLAGRVRGEVTEHSGEIKQQLGGMAHQVRDNLRQPTQEAAGQVRSRAAEGASTVREQGRSTAQEVRGQAKESAEDVRHG